MIETNRFFGAERFIFYNLASRRNTLNLLKYYQNKGVVDIVNFTLPINNKTNKTINIHYHGQLVSLLDCVYRNIYKSNFVTHLDVDEVIMPHHAELNSLSKIVNYFIGKNNKTCSCIFHVAFYSPKRAVPSPLNLAEIGRHVMFLNRTLREGDFWDIPRRSKSIVDASKVIMPGIHFVRRCEGTKSDAVEVAPSIGILHHYRDANARYADRNKRVEDTFSRMFLSEVTERIDAVKTAMKISWLKKHKGKVATIFVPIGSYNGLSPIRHQAIIWTSAWLLSIGLLGIKFSEIFIKIKNFSFRKMHLKISSAKRRPFVQGKWVKSICASSGVMYTINIALVLWMILLEFLIKAHRSIDLQQQYIL